MQILTKMLLLKTAPQDLPYSFRVMNQLFVLYIISGILIQVETLGMELTIGVIVINVVTVVIFTYFALFMMSTTARMLQTLSAIFGTSIFYNLLAWPFIGLLNGGNLSELTNFILVLLVLTLIGWELIVVAHIYRHALNLKMVSAVILSMVLYIILKFLIQIFIPEPV